MGASDKPVHEQATTTAWTSVSIIEYLQSSVASPFPLVACKSGCVLICSCCVSVSFLLRAGGGVGWGAADVHANAAYMQCCFRAPGGGGDGG